MEILSNVVNYLLSLGAAIFVPIIIIIAGLIVGMKVKDAISSGITLGVAFTGMTMLISFMTGAISPAAEAMLETVGISLPIVDGGWTTMSTISWSWPYAFLMFPLMIGINVLMLVINKTNTFNADLWNVWGKIFTAVAVVGITGSVPLAFAVAAVQIVFELKSADAHQHRIETLSGIPGVTCTHKMVFLAAIFYPIDKLLRKIPALDKDFDAESLKDKVGIFAENHVLGFILGCVFGVLARYSIAETLTLAIQAATALTLFPVITKYFMQALSPISEAVSDFMNKRFEGRTLLVGLDWPFMGGSNEIWLAVIYSVPVTLIFSMFLPGNEILPFAGIINIALAVPAFLVTGGNLLRMIILCTIGSPIFLWVGTAFAPFMTNLANTTGAVQLEAGKMISNSSIDGPVFTYAFSHVFKFLEGNFIPLIILIVWVVSFIFYYRDLMREAKAAQQLEQEEPLEAAEA
ncbi:PTS galactitol transporter subunit IIC [Candidatus Enterococcus clewellii]|uniref:PTS system Galactitol-specific IIC component n=1 Tax=Candidatus Enterococcus clewellii TaxID=1834193 RepID=A0A242JXL2_9ENTE|nr:PTS transporter subunit IIC [Enterococcus sp. 9E7_DIV0242]OTP09859.1 PTS system Galactitol-specific IIC component [Enterococcus sp. 9E7_DIV0242]